jgi:sulfur relay (sulfurtransferase) DsrC/TusE family protein
MMASVKDDYTRSFISEDWKEDSAKTTAAAEDLILTDDHFLVLHALQEYYSRHGIKLINVRELRDALDEKFHHKGGMAIQPNTDLNSDYFTQRIFLLWVKSKHLLKIIKYLNN